MSDIVIKVENVSKLYRLGEVGTGTISHDFNRWWHKVRGKEDPYLKVGQVNDRTTKGDSDYAWALQDVSFEVKQGEVLGIIGRNGAGKSTLLKILSRVTTPTSGQIKIKGRIASLLEVGTGFNPELTGRDNIYLNGSILGMRKREIDAKFDEIVAFAEVERYIDTPVKRYSSGMYVRLAFAVAAHLEPEILIVDEVLAVGDAEFQKKCMGKMQDVSKRGRTILFVSHNMAAVTKLCHRCIMLKNGTPIASGSTNSVIDAYIRDSSSTTNFSLDNFPERSGSGSVRLTGFCLEDTSGNKINQVQSGSDFNLAFQFKCASSAGSRRVNIGISIHQPDETTICVFYASHTGQIFEHVPSNGTFRCRVNRFPLKEGHYLIAVRVEANGEEADWPRGMVGTLEVIAGDFYGSGVKGFEGSAAPLLLSANWSLE